MKEARDPHADLLARRGLEHEQSWLRRFRDDARRVVEIGEVAAGRDWERDAARTIAAMRDGADVVYQGVLADDGWRGVSDFLVRVETPSTLGGWSYEAWDTKLARHSRPSHVLQLCFYTQHVARIQGVQPDRMHVVLGTGVVDSFRSADFSAYYATVRRRFLAVLQARHPTYPFPVPHCSVCDHARACEQRREVDDHLSLIAQIRRAQIERLNEAGIHTGAQLATIDLPSSVGVGRSALERLRHQAQLQTHHRETGQHRYELLGTPAAGDPSGFRLLPAPSPGDVFFDMEGDPYYEAAGGLEYLFGFVTLADAQPLFETAETPVFQCFRALSRDEEQAAFERFIDLVCERLRTWPDLHVYHYAAYEITALKRLMSQYGTREEELDDLLRREVFVDLYQVVRQSIRMSHRSYSIKNVRTFFMEGAGQGLVTDGGGSILEFERWRETGDPAILEAIVRYNEEDCVSTWKLRDWLLERRQEAERATGIAVPWKAVQTPAEKPERAVEDAATKERREALLARAAGPIPPADAARRELAADDVTRSPAAEGGGRAGGAMSPERDAVVLLADLLNYHRREAKPEWWAYFDRRRKSLDELMDDTQAIAGLEQVTGIEPERVAKSLVHTLAFPPQEFKLSAGAKVEDPVRGGPVCEIAWLDAQAGRLGLKRGPSRADAPLPSAIAAGAPIDTRVQRAAVARVADETLGTSGRLLRPEEPSRGSRGTYSAVRNLLERAAPRMAVPAGSSIQTLDIDEQRRLVAALDHSCLFIQGPPGSGKTYTGARLIVSLVAQGRRVGVAANSHKAINNLLQEVEAVAAATGVALTGLKKGTGDDELRGRFIRDTDSNEECETADVDLIAGTGWLFSRAGMDQRLDHLFIDEAGQIALADAVAMGTAARNLVLLGDPQQLPHVRQGTHPGNAGRSVLEHVLGEASTVAEDRGLFLARSWRMHPRVCAFVSELSYDGRLDSAPGCEQQRVDSGGLSGAGLRFLPVEHAGNSQQSQEEADAVAREVARLLDAGTFTGSDGRTRPLAPADIMVVAPFNMQVRCLTDALPPGVQVGTVDKFQGREAPVVFFSMASSTGEDVPRGLEFLFSRNRFNVAISRARALAVVVCSPRLLDVRCRNVEQMRLVNAVCRLVERAE